MISALVVTLPADPIERSDLLSRLTRDPRIVIGERIADRLAIAAETMHAREGAGLVDELAAMPGVRVDVVALDFGDVA